ncbi:transposase [Thalassomonas viridans]|uniref:Transposase n=1 Tax=Thalassomonas viridans TaxID=137584 RepID=A0AAE9ZDS7_9GAMM|nr:transposase [Thalassomonas viridans]WDE08657.1 transposase [Thalassomonas viridans]
MWCLGKPDSDFITQMEAALELYARPAKPVATKPGQVERLDNKYRREAVANNFMMYGWRHTKAIRTKNFAQCMKALVDEHCPDVEQIHIVLDNYCPHKPGSLYKTFPPAEARRILRIVAFHYTPKHANWLSMVEIKSGIMKQQCLIGELAAGKLSEMPRKPLLIGYSM